jgi:uncharacterized repeat protein (TIGR01451 family)
MMTVSHNKRHGRALAQRLLIGLCLSVLMPCATLAISPPVGTEITNRAQVDYSDQNQSQPMSAQSPEVVTVVSAGCRIIHTISITPNPAEPGENVTVSIYYANVGNASATNGRMLLTLDQQLTFLSASDQGQQQADPYQVEWTLPDTISPGESNTLTVTARISDATAMGAVLTADMAMTADQGGCEDQVSLPVGRAANLQLEKSVDRDTIAPDGILTYTLSYRNTGNQTATSVSIRDALPGGTVYVSDSATAGGILDNRTLSWSIGDVPSGDVGLVSFQVKVSSLAIQGQTITNQATILGSGIAAIASNQTLTTVTTESALTLTKTAARAFLYASDSLTYTLAVQNNSATTVANVLLTDTLPANTGFVEASHNGQAVGQLVTWDLGDLAAGTEVDVTVSLRYTESFCSEDPDRILTNSAEVTGNSVAPHTATATTPVLGRTQATIVFLDDNDDTTYFFKQGETIHLQLTDLDQNQDTAAVETVQVILTSDSGDKETVTLTETGIDTGIFTGSIPGDDTGPNQENGTIHTTQDTPLLVSYTDPVDGDCTTKETILIDPFGIVFDSVTGEPIENATVTLIDDSTGLAADLSAAATGHTADQDNPVVTDASGAFQFQFIPAGDYRLRVDIDTSLGYTFPSGMSANELVSRYPDMAIHEQGSFYLAFELTEDMAPLNIDIPVDPEAGSSVSLAKTANKTSASIGDLVTYQITLTNSSTADIADLDIVDVMPSGIHYLDGTSSQDGTALADPSSSSGRTLQWSIPLVAAGDSVTLTYKAAIGVTAKTGKAVNTAVANVSGVPVSNSDTHEIQIGEGVFTSRGTIIGKIFNDANQDRLQDENEQGLAGITVYLENGAWAVTDEFGKYSFPVVQPGTHVVKVDKTTLPDSAPLHPLSNRFMGAADSQFVDMQPGGLHKANFAVSGLPTQQAEPQTEDPAQEGEQPVAEADTEKQADTELAEALKSMNRTFEILSPVDGAILSRHTTDVLVKFPLGGNVALTLNGREIPEQRIGQRLTYKPGRVALVQYIAIELEPGQVNQLSAEMKDSFGNVRGNQTITLQTIGQADHLTMVATPDHCPADGRSTITIQTDILDAQGRHLPTDATITVESGNAPIIDEDADPANYGHQIRCSDGRASFSLRAPRTAGEEDILVTYNDLEVECTVTFTPHLRDLFMVGVAELTLGKGNIRGDFSEISHSDNDWFEDGDYSGARGAFFLKGRLGEKTLLTAAYDSHKAERDDCFSDDETDVDDEEKYPLYGDESERGYEASSRHKLYVRADRGQSYAMYGDIRTDLSETRLSAHQRTLTGLKTEIKTERLAVKAFGADTDQTQVVDAIRGRGISGLYYLSYRDLVEGGETVTIETRDRYRTSTVLSRETMTNGSDYEIDYELGTLLFKEPVASRDNDFNPIYIVVNYETQQEDAHFYTYGGRAAFKATQALTLGTTAIVTETGIDDETLFGADLTLKLPRETTLHAEIAQTDTLFTIDDESVMRDGTAWSLELESHPLPGLTIKPYLIKADDYFYNASAIDVERGIRQMGLKADYKLDATTTLSARVIDERDHLNDYTYCHASAGVKKRVGKTTLGAELISERTDGDYTSEDDDSLLDLSSSSSSLSSYELSDETASDTVGAKLSLETPLRQNLTLSLSHQHDLKGGRHNISQAGLELKLPRGTQVYLREEYARYEESRETRTLFGMETTVAKNTVGFSEYGLSGGMDGSSAQQSIGLRNNFMLGENLTGNLTAENLTTLSGDDDSDDDGFATAIALEYLGRKNLKLSSRLEWRKTGDETSYLTEFNAVTKLSRDYSLLSKLRHFTDIFEDEGRRNTSRLLLGLAYRPVKHDRFNALTKFEYKHEDDCTNDPETDTDSFIGSAEAAYQVNRDLQLIGKYAGKLSREDGDQAYTDLLSGRILFDLTERFDCSIGYRLLHSYDTDTLSHGGYAEVGARIRKNLWLALGYSFDKFDADLADNDYQGQGPYIRLRFKFDEALRF